MVRLNKKQLTNNQLEKLFAQFNTIVGNLSFQDTNLLLSDLLGSEEKIMLAKRLGIIILLLEGYSLYKISSILKVSPTTAKNLKSKIESGELANLVKMLGKNKKNYFAILKTLDSILHLGGVLPHYSGPGSRLAR